VPFLLEMLEKSSIFYFILDNLSRYFIYFFSFGFFSASVVRCDDGDSDNENPKNPKRGKTAKGWVPSKQAEASTSSLSGSSRQAEASTSSPFVSSQQAEAEAQSKLNKSPEGKDKGMGDYSQENIPTKDLFSDVWKPEGIAIEKFSKTWQENDLTTALDILATHSEDVKTGYTDYNGLLNIRIYETLKRELSKNYMKGTGGLARPMLDFNRTLIICEKEVLKPFMVEHSLLM